MNYFNFSYQFFCVLARILPAPLKIRKRACFKMDELFMIKTFEDNQPAPCAPLKIRGRAWNERIFLCSLSNLSILIGRPRRAEIFAGGLSFIFKRSFI